MKRALKIILSNWINLLGVFLIVYIYANVVIEQTHPQYNLFQSLVASGISVCLYGVIFWASFIVALILLDILLVLFVKPRKVSLMLFIEWLLISGPSIYWAIENSQWIFVVGMGAFGISQFLRVRKILSWGT